MSALLPLTQSRAECLNAPWFMSLDDARSTMEDCRKNHNEVRPHSAKGNIAALRPSPGKYPAGRATQRKQRTHGQELVNNRLFDMPGNIFPLGASLFVKRALVR